MKLIIQNGRIAGCTGDDYVGTETVVDAPAGFDPDRMNNYRLQDGDIVEIMTPAELHWEAIKRERDRRTQAGGYQAAGKWFHSDTFSRTQQVGLMLMGGNIPANLQWKTMDGSFVTMTQTLAGQVFAAAAASDAALFARAEQIKAVMEADPANFDLASQTWPAFFGE